MGLWFWFEHLRCHATVVDKDGDDKIQDEIVPGSEKEKTNNSQDFIILYQQSLLFPRMTASGRNKNVLSLKKAKYCGCSYYMLE
jgi:hypothetical protein